MKYYSIRPDEWNMCFLSQKNIDQSQQGSKPYPSFPPRRKTWIKKTRNEWKPYKPYTRPYKPTRNKDLSTRPCKTWILLTKNLHTKPGWKKPPVKTTLPRPSPVEFFGWENPSNESNHVRFLDRGTLNPGSIWIFPKIGIPPNHPF